MQRLFQTTAMYYMCYYTMLREPILDGISRCHVRNEKSNKWGRTFDYRSYNAYAFQCAMHLFCPGQQQFLRLADPNGVRLIISNLLHQNVCTVDYASLEIEPLF